MMAVRRTDDGCLTVSKPMLALAGAIIAVSMSLLGWSLSALFDSQGKRFVALATNANELHAASTSRMGRIAARLI